MVMMAGYLVANLALLLVTMLVVAVYYRMWYISMQNLRHHGNPNRSSQEAGDHDTSRDFRTHSTVHEIFL
jgi:hypothetical protein